MQTALGIYAYPWDVARVGADRVLRELTDLGFSSIDVSANYHSIGAFSPRGDAPSVFFAPRGGVYYPWDPDRFGAVIPPAVPDAVQGVWEALDKAAPVYGVELNAWTIGMFQPWMAQDYPSTARVLATGDRSDVGVCPSNPDVVEFYANLAGDLTSRFQVHEVRLEGFGFPPLDYGWVRGRFLTPLTEPGRWNLALCFCDSCARRARDRGIDVTGLRRRTLERVRGGTGYGRQAPLSSWRTDLMAEDPELAAYEEMRQSAVTELVRTAATAAAANGAGGWICTPQELCGSQSPPLGSIVDLLTGAMAKPAAAAVRPTGENIDDLQAEWASIREVAHRAGRTVRISAFALAVESKQELTSAGALAYLGDLTCAGPDEIVIYNYGLLTEETLATLARTVRGADRRKARQ